MSDKSEKELYSHFSTFAPMRKWLEFDIGNKNLFRSNLLTWLQRFEHGMLLDSNAHEGERSSVQTADLLAAAGSADEMIARENTFDALKNFYERKKDWLFGCIEYDTSLYFFQPVYVFLLRDKRLHIGFLPELVPEEEVKLLFQRAAGLFQTDGLAVAKGGEQQEKPGDWTVSKEEYMATVKQIQRHIQRGDIYEMNYCIEYSAKNVEINPEEVFLRLNEKAQSPFSAFCKRGNKYLLCASPERFLRKEGGKIISQPIKGTRPRGNAPGEDRLLKEQLLHSQKEQSENVMIVDLVRNDLSRTCTHVRVEELFGIYTFAHWHQMISTISGKLRKGVHGIDVIRHAFPMGSMTGAPKLRAMELIEKFEKTKRGWYSGSAGYFAPAASFPPHGGGEHGERSEGAFDFNVVIRSIVYDAGKKELSFHSGSAVTARSVPEQEYEECMLKARAMLEALAVHPPSLPVPEKEIDKHAETIS